MHLPCPPAITVCRCLKDVDCWTSTGGLSSCSVYLLAADEKSICTGAAATGACFLYN